MSNFNPLFIIIPAMVFFAVVFIIKYFKGRKLIPNLKTGKVLFHVKGASGYSNKSFLTKAGGANGVLRISIIDDHLHFWGSPIFASFGGLYDLLHAIPIENILEVNHNKKKIYINFLCDKEEKEFVILRMNKQVEFLEILDKLRHKKRASL